MNDVQEDHAVFVVVFLLGYLSAFLDLLHNQPQDVGAEFVLLDETHGVYVQRLVVGQFVVADLLGG